MRSGVATISTTLHRGGAEMRTLEVVRALSSPSLEVHVVAVASAGAPHPLEPEFRAAGARIRFLPLRTLTGWWGAYRLFRRVRVVHCQAGLVAGPLVALAWLAGTPIRVAHFHSDRAELPAGLGGRALSTLGGWFVRRFATSILGVSEKSLENVLGAEWSQDGRTQIVVPGVDLSRFASVSAVPGCWDGRLGLPEGARTVLHIGIDTVGKNRIKAVAALGASEHEDLHLVFVGSVDETLRAECFELATTLGVAERVHWTGERADVPDLLTAATALIVTSSFEGVPGVVLEAVAAGTPVLASDLPSIREIAGEAPDSIEILSLGESDDVWGTALSEVTSRVRRSTTPWTRLAGTRFDASTTITRFARLWCLSEPERHRPVVVHMFSSLAYGGAEMRTLELIRQLSPDSYSIVMLQTSPTPGPLTSAFEQAGARVITVRFRSLAFIRTVSRLFRTQPVHAVHVHVMLGHERSNILLVMAKAWRVPNRVLHYRNEGRIPHGRPGAAGEWVLHRIGMNAATTVGGVSPGALEAVLGKSWRADERAALMLPGLAVARFAAASDSMLLRRLIGHPEADRVLLVLGRDDPQKNREWAVDVLEALIRMEGEKTHMVFVGKSERSVADMVGEREWLARFAHMMPPTDDVPGILGGADVMLLPSRHEGLPGVVMESLAAGTPVVATRLPGTEFIAEEFGDLLTLVDLSESAERWAREVIRTGEAVPTTPTARREAFQRVSSSKFAMDRVAREYESAWGVSGTNES